jgi:hypothetical protein
VQWQHTHARKIALRLFEIARVLVRRDHVASFIVNTNDSIARVALSKIPKIKACRAATVSDITGKSEKPVMQ